MVTDKEKLLITLQNRINDGRNRHTKTTTIFISTLSACMKLLKEQNQTGQCKDCKWWDKKDESNYGYCHACKHGFHSNHWEIGIYRIYREDWYCADWEEKDDDEDDD